MQDLDRDRALLPKGRGIAVVAAVGCCLLSGTPAHAAADLELIPDPIFLISLVAFFCGLVFVLDALIFKPIFGILDERTAQVDGARDRAETVVADADSLLQSYNSSINEARADAEMARKGRIAEVRGEQTAGTAAARAEADSRVESARTELALALDEAREGLRAGSRDLAQAAAQRVLGREL